jgi:IS4 transposase
MARRNESSIRNALTSLISPQLIRRRAATLLTVKRERRVDIVALVYTLVLGFDRGAKRTIAGLRRAYTMSTETTLARSAFYDRFTPALAELMRQLMVHAFERLSLGTTKLHGALSAFTKVAIADGSIIRLHDALRADYPSVWTNHTKAGAKLHAVIDGATRTPSCVRIVPGSRHDVTLLSVEADHRGTLFVFDLAYYQGKLFRRILDAQGQFLCRVKKDADFRITAATTPGLVGRGHREILPSMAGKSFEVQVDYEYQHSSERDWKRRHIDLRLIGVWCAEIKKHRLYITSTTPTQLSAEVTPAVYAMRWEIELMFRELKTQLRLEDMPSGNKAVTECLLYASLLALALGRQLHRALQDHWARTSPASRTSPTERFSAVLRALTPLVLDLLLVPPQRRHSLERRIRRMLDREAPDPNRKRMLLRQRAQLGVLRQRSTAA